MRSREKSTPLGPIHRDLVLLARELTILHDRLGRIARKIRPGRSVLLAEIRGVIERVRSDLLSDAIETLGMLPHLTEDKVLRRHADLADLVGWSDADERE